VLPSSRLARTALLALSVSLASPLAPVHAAEPGHHTVEIVAHAGGLASAPQNTVAAVRLAIQHGADVIENDVQVTADGRLVVLHNTSLAMTTDVEEVFPDRSPWNVADFTLAEIRRLDAGSWFAPEFTGQRVPTLREWARAVGDDVDMLIEAKTPELYPGMDQALAQELATRPVFRRALRQDRLTVMSFDHTWLRGFHRLSRDVPIGLLYPWHATAHELLAAARWADSYVPAISVVDGQAISTARLLGMRTYVWTVNVPTDMRTLVRWRVDGIITDAPALLRRTLRTSLRGQDAQFT
jgi:glycerophosphoryl diester phosphodiesterase